MAEGAHMVSLRCCTKICRCSQKQGTYPLCERQPGTQLSARNKVHSWSSHSLSRTSGQMNAIIYFSSVLLGMRGELVFCVEP